MRLSLICLSIVTGAATAGEPRMFVSNEYFTFGSPDDFSVSIDFADFDADGDLDALIVNGRHWARQDRILLNNGQGRFLVAHPLGEVATGYKPAIADLDGDGIADIVVARDRIPSVRYRATGGARFEAALAVGESGPARAVVTGDFDRDGHTDLAFSLRSATNYVVFGPEFTRIAYFGDAEQSVRLAVVDVDADDDDDVAFANLGNEGSGVYLNDGAGGFGHVQRFAGVLGPAVDVAAGDFDGDGRPDLAFAAVGANVVFLNDPRHGFSEAVVIGPEDERSYGIAAGDLDNDGDPDIVVANDGAPNAVYLNDGARFERLLLPDDPDARSYAVAIADLDGDGFRDLAFANSGSMSRVYLNTTREQAESVLRR